MPYTPPSQSFQDNTNPVGGGVGQPLDADFFTALVAGVDDADTRITAVEADYSRQTRNLANVKEFGALGNGVADDTAAITAADATGRGLYFPPGTYLYNGPGLSRNGKIQVIGSGHQHTVIVLPTGGSFLVASGLVPALTVSGIQFNGGFGAIRFTNTGSNVGGYCIVEDCRFIDYTGAAISHKSIDFPYWKIQRCFFWGKNYTSTIGAALPGLADEVAITDCSFVANRVHIKLGQGGNNAHVTRCDFLRFGVPQGSPRVDVWVVPAPDLTNAGAGFSIRDCKFGNEHFAVGDVKVCYADEGAGTAFADKFPVLDVASSGYILGHALTDSLIFGAGDAPAPIVFSTTNNVRDCQIRDIQIAGAQPTFAIQYLTPPGPNQANQGNAFGPFFGFLGAETTLPFPSSNGSGVGPTQDPLAVFRGRTAGVQSDGVGDPTGYVNLLTTRLTSATNGGSQTYTATADSLGGTEAIEVSMLSGGLTYVPLVTANIKPGQPAWIEFDIAAGTTSSLTQFRAGLQYTNVGLVHWRRVAEVPAAGWVRYRYPWTPREATTTINLIFTSLSATGSVKVGRARVYHAREPQPTILSDPNPTVTTTAPAAGAAGAVPATPAGYLTINVGGTLRKVAYY